MRRPKHRHHPDIWRERRRAETAGRKRWFRPVTMAEFVGCYTNAARTPGVLTLDEMTALAAKVWDSALPLDEYWRVPAGVLVASAESPPPYDRGVLTAHIDAFRSGIVLDPFGPYTHPSMSYDRAKRS